MPRIPNTHYQDPVDLIWLQAATRLGITVVRSADAYASWDGKGTLTLSCEEHLDADDCLAQMILHELCHLLVSGEGARQQTDWGLDNTSPRDLVYEYATNRLQAALAQALQLAIEGPVLTGQLALFPAAELQLAAPLLQQQTAALGGGGHRSGARGGPHGRAPSAAGWGRRHQPATLVSRKALLAVLAVVVMKVEAPAGARVERAAALQQPRVQAPASSSASASFLHPVRS